MKDQGSRPTLRSYLADSGVPPEKFLEALGILRDEIRAILDNAESAAASPTASPSAPPDDASENDSIRRILGDLKARWVQQDRAKARAENSPSPPPTPPAPEAPPATSPDSGRITLETVVLKGPAGGRSPLRPPGPPEEPPAAAPAAREQQPGAAPPAAPPPAEDQPTTFIRVDAGAAPAPCPSPPAGEEIEEPLLETVVRRPGDTPPGGRARRGTEPPPEPVPAAPEEDDMAKTVILRPDQIKPKGKGGPR